MKFFWKSGIVFRRGGYASILRQVKNKFKDKSSFTLIELLVVVSISVLLSSILILYSHSSRQQIALYSERARLAQAIFSAKSFSLSFYRPVLNTYCGYGVHINYLDQSYSIFRYNKAGISDCRTINSINPNLQEIISTVKVDSNVELVRPSTGPSLDDVIFVPPDPVTVINSGGNIIAGGEVDVVIQTLDGSLSNSVGVNPAGLINF